MIARTCIVTTTSAQLGALDGKRQSGYRSGEKGSIVKLTLKTGIKSRHHGTTVVDQFIAYDKSI